VGHILKLLTQDLEFFSTRPDLAFAKNLVLLEELFPEEDQQK